MKLSAQHLKAIEALAMGENNKVVAEKLNLAPETVSRWLADFEFKARLNSLIEESHQATKDRLRHLSSVALETIEEIMSDSEAPPLVRVTASLKILELTKLKCGAIGSDNPEVLKKREEEDSLMRDMGF